MKVLYESIINADWRHRLGEYYTPDWLAESIVIETVDRPLEQRVLDPSCGSGTFLFQAVRHYLDAATEAGMSDAEAITGATEHVFGIDVHPVAITLARLTYLLAIGRDRLQAPGRPDIHVPVWLGDSVQCRTAGASLWAHDGLMIGVDDDVELLASSLSGGQDPEGMLRRAAEAGGEILTPLTFIGEMPWTRQSSSPPARHGLHLPGADCT